MTLSDSRMTSAEPTTAMSDLFAFEASDVTGTHHLVAEGVQRSLPAGEVANALARDLALPTNVPWALRDDRTSAFLDDDSPIGDQIEANAKVTLTPKTHLG